MDDIITPKDISKLIELRKIRAELEFQKFILAESEEEPEISKRIENMSSDITRLTGRIQKAQLVVAMPNEGRIEEYNSELDSIDKKEIFNALKSKTGPVYETLLKRGKILKENLGNRDDIAKLVLLGNTLEEDKKKSFFDSLRSGVIADSSVEGIEEPKKVNLMRLLRRIGFISSTEKHDEVLVDIKNQKVWVGKEKEQDILSILESLSNLNSKIQLKNAEKQVKVFSEEEEKEFQELQQEYLNLLKEKDGLLKDFYDEEKQFSYKALQT